MLSRGGMLFPERWETTKNIDVDNKEFIFTYNDIEPDGSESGLRFLKNILVH